MAEEIDFIWSHNFIAAEANKVSLKSSRSERKQPEEPGTHLIVLAVKSWISVPDLHLMGMNTIVFKCILVQIHML